LVEGLAMVGGKLSDGRRVPREFAATGAARARLAASVRAIRRILNLQSELNGSEVGLNWQVQSGKQELN
jgi:hypothetical protein